MGHPGSLDINVRIVKGDHRLAGSNGAGKSTLMKGLVDAQTSVRTDSLPRRIFHLFGPCPCPLGISGPEDGDLLLDDGEENIDWAYLRRDSDGFKRTLNGFINFSVLKERRSQQAERFGKSSRCVPSPGVSWQARDSSSSTSCPWDSPP
jgi:hypothetical protein